MHENIQVNVLKTDEKLNDWKITNSGQLKKHEYVLYIWSNIYISRHFSTRVPERFMLMYFYWKSSSDFWFITQNYSNVCDCEIFLCGWCVEVYTASFYQTNLSSLMRQEKSYKSLRWGKRISFEHCWKCSI